LTTTAVAEATAPTPLPPASELASLPQPVAITLLVTSVVLAGLVHFGPVIRDRIRPRPAEDDQPGSSSPSTQTPPVVDRTDQFLQHLLRQIAEAQEREDELERQIRERDERIERLEREVVRLEREVLRLESLLWRRPTRD